eukprot:1433032-Pyramimonas_sp.AAC.2
MRGSTTCLTKAGTAAEFLVWLSGDVSADIFAAATAAPAPAAAVTAPAASAAPAPVGCSASMVR